MVPAGAVTRVRDRPAVRPEARGARADSCRMCYVQPNTRAGQATLYDARCKLGASSPRLRRRVQSSTRYCRTRAQPGLSATTGSPRCAARADRTPLCFLLLRKHVRARHLCLRYRDLSPRESFWPTPVRLGSRRYRKYEMSYRVFSQSRRCVCMYMSAYMQGVCGCEMMAPTFNTFAHYTR